MLLPKQERLQLSSPPRGSQSNDGSATDTNNKNQRQSIQNKLNLLLCYLCLSLSRSMKLITLYTIHIDLNLNKKQSILGKAKKLRFHIFKGNHHNINIYIFFFEKVVYSLISNVTSRFILFLISVWNEVSHHFSSFEHLQFCKRLQNSFQLSIPLDALCS